MRSNIASKLPTHLRIAGALLLLVVCCLAGCSATGQAAQRHSERSSGSDEQLAVRDRAGEDADEAAPDAGNDTALKSTSNEESSAGSRDVGPMVRQGGASPVEPAPPKIGSGGCATRAEGRRVLEETNAFVRETTLREAYQQGWKRLIDIRQFDGRPHTLSAVRPGGARGEGPGALFVDSDGHHWLVVYESTSCEPVTVDFFVDADHNVFAVHPERQCQRTKKVPVCGPMGAGGCGRPGPLRRLYARVPADARLEPFTTVPVKIPTCYQVEPKGGFIPRP